MRTGTLSGLIATARRTAQRRKQRPSTAHAVLVLLQQEGDAAALLAQRGLREIDLISALKVADEEPASAIEVAAERAARLAQTHGAARPGPLHLLAAIVKEPRSAGYRCLEHAGASPARLRDDVLARLAPAAPTGSVRERLAPKARAHGNRGARASTARSPDRAPRRPSASPRTAKRARAGRGETYDLDPDRYPILGRLGRNLTALAARGALDPLIGRDRELDQLLDILARRRANNPLVVGPPGVGKSALVEGLAQRLLEVGEGGGRILVELSVGALTAGTGVRGALAERVRQLQAEVKAQGGRVLLFLDEIHTAFGGDGPDDLAQELKASLARGTLPCIGATTEAEARRAFARDPALARRFTRVEVAEPCPDDALAILAGLAPRYARHHGVRIEASALEAAVELGVRYLSDGFLPDKALGVVDLAAARARRRGADAVDRAAVAEVIAARAQVPLDRLLRTDGERLLGLEEHLRARVIGQDRPLGRIADALRKAAAGFRGRRPLGTFLLLGPTGVGKTETAKAVAEALFPGSGMTRFDLSELSEAHGVARLVGAPPGYIGHEDGGQLTEAVRRRPYQLLLLDEVEKAHRDVLLALLPMLDEGRLTDGRGRTADFTNTVVVMTSNLGVEAAARAAVGFGSGAGARPDRSEAILEAARRALPPELWNRIDEPLVFAPLGEREAALIAERMLREVGRVLAEEHRVALEVDPSAVQVLVRQGFDPELGARPMRRAVARCVESPLARALLGGRLAGAERVRLRGRGDEVVVEAEGAGTRAAS